MPGWWRGQGVTDDKLIALLCVRISMIMEDVCGEAVMARADPADELHALVAKLAQAGARMFALVNATTALADCN